MNFPIYYLSHPFMRRIEEETKPALCYQAAIGSLNQLCGIKIVEMPNQKANAWAISDKTIAESYEAGRITEDDLRAIAKLNNQIAENQ